MRTPPSKKSAAAPGRSPAAILTTVARSSAPESATGFGDVEVANAATLGGTGTISGSLFIDAGATFAPGNSVGALNIGTDLNLDPASASQFTLGTSSSSATVAGNLSLAGTLNISAAAGFGAGIYTLFNYSGALNLGSVVISAPAGFNYSLNTNTPGQVKLIVARPQFNLVNVSGSNLIMSGSGGAANATYYILSSTNIALPLNLWTRIATNQFDASGNFNFTNAINANAPQQFYLLQLP
jgi:hypothetical protein